MTSVIKVPRVLMAETPEQRQAVMEAISSALAALRLGAKIHLDFTGTARLFPGGMLMLLAWIELMMDSWPNMVRARCAPHSLAAQLLRHFGFADRLGVGESISKPKHASVVNWQYLTGTLADGQKISDLLSTYRALAAAAIPEGLYDVLAEALTNVRHHAYPEGGEDLPDTLKRWWLFAKYDAPTGDGPGSLYIAVYDIGIGVQRSMRRRLEAGELVLDVADEIISLLRMKSSGKLERLLMKRAVENRRSATGQRNRGNGLPEMRDFVLGTKTGRLHIVSGAAQYSCVPAQTYSDAIGCDAVPGTLILWSLPLLPSSKDAPQ